MTTWILILLAALLALTLLVFLVGPFLPANYTATARLTTPLSPDALWARIADHQNHPVTAKMCKRVESLPEENGLPVWIEDMGHTKIRVQTVTSDPPRRLVRRMADQALPMTATLLIEVAPHGTGSQLTVHNHTVVARGTWHVPLFRTLMTLTGGVRGGVRAYVTQLLGGTAGGTRLAWDRAARPTAS